MCITYTITLSIIPVDTVRGMAMYQESACHFPFLLNRVKFLILLLIASAVTVSGLEGCKPETHIACWDRGFGSRPGTVKTLLTFIINTTLFHNFFFFNLAHFVTMTTGYCHIPVYPVRVEE